MKISAVICGRNDNYGGHLNESATYSINTILETFDEVIYVDWNTEYGKSILTDNLKLKNREKLRVITVTPSMCEEFMGKENYNKGQKMCEVLARNVGIRRATGHIIVDTNIDVIVPPRKYLDLLLKELKQMEMITIAKQDVELSDLDKQFGKDSINWPEFQSLMPLLFGNWPISKRLMSPYLAINKDILDKIPVQNHHTVASIIMACGDFQIAHRDTWWKIRGFEESMIKRLYIDTSVQYKVIMAGGSVRATNFPPVYHIEHHRDNNPSVQNSIEMNNTTTNPTTWGFSDRIKV